MMKLLVPLCLVGVALGPRFIKSRSYEPQDRIVGGSETSITDYPYAVSIQHRRKHSCGGSIISKKYILTAAHCVFDSPKTYTVRVGSTDWDEGGTVYQVKNYVVHPKYNPDEFYEYDIALMELQKSIEISPSAQPVELPDEGRPVEVGEVGVVVGWGRLKSEGKSPKKLQQVSIPVSEIAPCNSTYWDMLHPTMFCAGDEKGGRDACQGDSGGPFVINDTQIGIVSFGLECGKAGNPGVYTNVPLLRSWISENSDV